MNTILNSSCFENLDEELMLIPVVGGDTGRGYDDQEPYFIFGGDDEGYDDGFDDEEYDDDFDDEEFDDGFDDD
ncbi:MAG: hypothetical protein LBB61_01520 [Treponema sp.]|nr:hypothetical protein [Treponema sp.]